MKRATLIIVWSVLFHLAFVGVGSVAAQVGNRRRQAGIYGSTVAYVAQSYPLWFTYEQSLLGNRNHLMGPNKISPVDHVVVAINDDMLYASTFADLSVQPLIVPIPDTSANYSVLTVDAYGDIFKTNLLAGKQGTYALTEPGWTGSLPSGVTAIPTQVNFFLFVFRIDKNSSDGTDLTKEAETFREPLKAQPLSGYLVDPTQGATGIKSEVYFGVPFKTVADALVAKGPISFLRQLQQAVASSNTPPLSTYEQQLSQRFDSFFGAGIPTGVAAAAFAKGAQDAHSLIVKRYLNHTDAAKWIHFTNIGNWGDNVIDRSAITEILQFGDGIDTAAYYHTFKDSKGRALDGIYADGYVLKFRATHIPRPKRFWSLTAYTLHSIELIASPANKYLVASYTPGLVKDSDGSLTIYITQQLPPGVPEANWLPVSSRPFNIMLRVYGPADGDLSKPILPFRWQLFGSTAIRAVRHAATFRAAWYAFVSRHEK